MFAEFSLVVLAQGPMPRLVLPLLLVSAVACERAEPPGARADDGISLSLGMDAGDAGGPRERSIGSIEDDLPFTATGEKLLSTAWRTWIYTDTGPKRTRLGYLRAGQIVDARGPRIENDGCKDGWYRINPRGFVCAGKGATLDLTHPLARSLARRPTRGAGFPYLYAMSGNEPPDRYFKLPTRAQMVSVEGERALDRGAAFVERARTNGELEAFGITDELPAFLDPLLPLDKPYGVALHERREVSAGRANPGGGFALVDAFLWQGRAFGVTTELDLIPLDRTRLRSDGAFSGVVLEDGESLPVAFHVEGMVTLWKETASGRLEPEAEVREQRGFKLTGKDRDGMLETKDGVWIAKSSVRVVEPRTSFPSVATGERRWIDVSVSTQTLVAYIGQKPVFATLISSGRGGLGEREDSNPDGERTVRGTFMIYEKAVSSTMNGDEDRADSYELLDVPFVQYFHRGFALHGAYWHDDFGKKRSHGCINLAARDAAWLFEWTDPPVPPGWHAVLNKERGTVVYVGY